MKIGFIGTGNMGSAMMGGMVSSGIVAASNVMASDIFQAALDRISDQLNIATSTNNRDVVDFADIVFLAVKPQYLAGAIDGIKDMDFTDKIVVSIAAGQSIEKLTELFGKQLKLIRVMPNTPALVGEAMSALSPNELVSEDEADIVLHLFESFGKAEIVPEKLQDAVVGISGSSPAYVYMFIEALADGAVAEGMPRAQAYKFAAQAVLGSAKMVLETGEHPGVLKDAVCSPGGTTIEAVATLEALGFRNAVIEAERVCVEKSRDL
ncbi:MULTISPECIES: pyrroline-5-carboxylate reductase [Pseudobutyrivibrio]|jgi:pyrroline-5-carboxylate reductase|uniref:Pyrroline-5-carboxylate reductase n=2 Tax=Pseudobutyrivibrio TaxID=46205 RepID=A0A2G3DYE3_9FIRM|nr:MULTISPECIES: pyrroline-5-carboxylate reductase [Pseudobutyrivibrio]MBE5904101.1 pyrroline-5-carboxylate reductase [Pseudobutyrivibrio sp.]NEX00555.1 pyrroline-5-carboxylate reductase [Pseudobutyrivibrio xylanivorans]PHU36067.1 pyrroline-5-carboxylate reductase [Pseudobutyrivibrio ruminis]SCX98683.1 pyrroline-5-carboxylate reductase [Pseudobutyrivibrio sp. AR14]SFR60923.1 pyrroline-5-carboxylate reductase [Pseudobutyrivibrio sp. NOR37]